MLKRQHIGLLLVITAVGLAIAYGIIAATFRPTSSTSADTNQIAWRSEFSPALLESLKTGKPILLVFSASWCQPCQIMKHNVWPSPEIVCAVGAAFIPVLLDVDAAENQSIARRCGIEIIPTILVVNSEGKILRQAHYLEVAELQNFLKNVP